MFIIWFLFSKKTGTSRFLVFPVHLIRLNIPVFGFDQWRVFTSILIGEIQDQSKERGGLECSQAARQWRCWCCLQLSSEGPGPALSSNGTLPVSPLSSALAGHCQGGSRLAGGCDHCGWPGRGQVHCQAGTWARTAHWARWAARELHWRNSAVLRACGLRAPADTQLQLSSQHLNTKTTLYIH